MDWQRMIFMELRHGVYMISGSQSRRVRFLVRRILGLIMMLSMIVVTLMRLRYVYSKRVWGSVFLELTRVQAESKVVELVMITIFLEAPAMVTVKINATTDMRADDMRVSDLIAIFKHRRNLTDGTIPVLYCYGVLMRENERVGPGPGDFDFEGG